MLLTKFLRLFGVSLDFLNQSHQINIPNQFYNIHETGYLRSVTRWQNVRSSSTIFDMSYESVPAVCALSPVTFLPFYARIPHS